MTTYLGESRPISADHGVNPRLQHGRDRLISFRLSLVSRGFGVFLVFFFLGVLCVLIFSSRSLAFANQPVEMQAHVAARKLRIQRIVMDLDRVGDVVSQMMPENADRVEPILEDLEDQAVGLSDRDEIQKSSVDEDLSQLEISVKKLSSVISKMIEPEVSI